MRFKIKLSRSIFSNKKKGQENLKEAIKIMEECGADGWVKKYEKELAALS